MAALLSNKIRPDLSIRPLLIAKSKTLFEGNVKFITTVGLFSPTFETLGDLYLNELRDLYSAEKQLLEALPKMAEAANSSQLERHALTLVGRQA
jgi:Domain of unknown function (DUF892)